VDLVEIGLASLQYIPSEPTRIMINEPLSVEVIKDELKNFNALAKVRQRLEKIFSKGGIKKPSKGFVFEPLFACIKEKLSQNPPLQSLPAPLG